MKDGIELTDKMIEITHEFIGQNIKKNEALEVLATLSASMMAVLFTHFRSYGLAIKNENKALDLYKSMLEAGLRDIERKRTANEKVDG